MAKNATLRAYKWRTTHFFEVWFFSLEREAQGVSISLKHWKVIFRAISTLNIISPKNSERIIYMPL